MNYDDYDYEEIKGAELRRLQAMIALPPPDNLPPPSRRMYRPIPKKSPAARDPFELMIDPGAPGD